MKAVYLTQEGYEKLKEERKKLEADRKEIIRRIKESREYGDLAENSEYASARDDQSINEGRIQELDALFKNVEIIEPAHSANGKAAMANTVSVEIEGEKDEFTLVGSAESDPANGMISIESPLGKALIGSKAGDKVKVAIPDGGTVEYTILAIS